MSKQNTTKKPSPLSSSLSSSRSTDKKHVSKPISIERHRLIAFRKTYAPKLAAVIKQLKSTRIIHDYVSVDSKGKDQKDVSVDIAEIDSLTLQLSLLKTAARAAIGSNHIKTILYYSGSGAAGAGVAYPSSFGLQPSACGEYAGYASLYDEVRVNAIKVHYVVQSASANLAENCFYAFGYDSTYNSTPSSVLDVMESQQHEIGVLPVVTPGSSSALIAMPSGARTFHIRIQRQPVANAASVTGGTGIIPNFPGEWMAAGDTADTVGFLRIFVERGGGTTATIAVSYKIEFLCEWRERT